MRLHLLTDPDPQKLSILKAIAPGPLLDGQGSGDDDLLCAQCSAPIGVSVPRDALWGIGLRCFQCGGVSFSPSPPPSRPVPLKAVPLGAGEFAIGAPIRISGSVPLVGIEAVSIRRREPAPALPAKPLGDAEALEQLASRGEQLLGERFARLAAAFRRSQERTRSKSINRLVQLIALAREDAAASRDGNPQVHLLEISELSMAVSLFERWQTDPCLKEMLASLANPPDFPHALITLGTASYLTDAGNPTELVPPSPQGRTPDLRVHIDLQRRVNVEVKTPKLLLWPEGPLPQEDLTPAIRKAMTKAGAGTRGQLDPTHPGALALGGFNLSDQDLGNLEASAKEVLLERPNERAHIGGVVLVNISHLVHGVKRTHKGLSIDQEFSTAPVLHGRLITNTSYIGETEFTTGGYAPEHLEEVPLAALQDAQLKRKTGRNDPCWCGSNVKFKRCHGR